MAYFKNSGTTSRGTDKLRNLDVELTKPEQVEQNVKALDVELRNSDYHAIDEAFADFA